MIQPQPTVPGAMTRLLSCGVLVTDGRHLLVGHATGSPRWDIPKGQADPGEAPDQAARRELEEETGLAPGAALLDLGQHRYLPRKDLALYAWPIAAMPEPAGLVCRSTFMLHGRAVPEFDRFACPAWAAAIPLLGKAMQGVLRAIALERGWL